MATDPNINNSFYAEFKDVRTNWFFVGCALPLGIIAAFGILFNFCVIFVTIRSKSLNGTANFLLALCSFFELLHQHCHFLFVFVAFSGLNFIEYQTAALITALSVFGMGGIAISMFFTGLDRFISVLFMQMHSKINLRFYLATITLVCLLFCAESLYTLYLTAEQLKGLMISGCIVDIVQGPSVEFFAPFNLYTNVVTSAIYVLIGITVKVKTAFSTAQSNLSASTNRRILRSLFAIIAVNISGYLLNVSYVQFFRPSISSPVTAWFWQVITGIPLNISAASNGPILYFTSTEYRQAFHSEFPFFFKNIQKINKPTHPKIVQMNTFTVNQAKVCPHFAISK